MPGERKSRPKTEASGFSAEERKAIRERSAELRATRTAQEQAGAVAACIGAMPPADAALARQVQDLVLAVCPQLSPRLWYGMPAYADQSGKVLCFFQASSKFSTRYSTLGFTDHAALDDGSFWPSAYAIAGVLGETQLERLADLLRRAVG